MWTLILITMLASGAPNGGVYSATSFLDFSDESKCRAAAAAMAGVNRVAFDPGPRPPISPPAIYRIVAQCVAR
jgi:hypothetical protein